jgi:Polyketide cyclase / dehydrase and lipid transport
MARVDVSTSSELEPEVAWQLASDLSRFGEWMTIFGEWRSPVPAPSEIEVGTQISACIKVKGFSSVVDFEVTRCDEPNLIEMRGRGRGGSRVVVAVNVTPKDPGSTFHLTANLSGGVLSGPIGLFVARIIRSNVRESVENLAALQ